MNKNEQFGDGLIGGNDGPVTFLPGASHFKVKARDIIAGWPKGRSTLPSFDSYFHNKFDSPRSFGPTLDHQADWYLDYLYHREQSEMIERYMHVTAPVFLDGLTCESGTTLDSHIAPTYGGIKRSASLLRGDFPWNK